jgi:hypothetical protein
MIAAFINISDLNYDMPILYASSVISLTIILTVAIVTGIEIYVIRAIKGIYQ